MSNPQFVVDVLSSLGVVLGSGPITSAVAVRVVESLDSAGEVSITIPATDVQALTLLANERWVRVKNAAGTLATGIVRKRTTKTGSEPSIEVGGPDLLDLLTRYSCGRARIYNDEALDTVVIPDLLDGTGWTAGTIDAGLGNVSARFDGETRLGAIQALRSRLGVHLRQGTTAQTLDLGAFGSDSGIRLVNVAHLTVDQESNTDIGIIGDLELVSDSWGVVNRILPYGSGDGEGQLTLQRLSGAARLAATHVRKGPRRASSGAWGTAGDMTLNVTDSTGFVAGDPVYIGPLAGTLTGSHETNEVASVATGVLTLRGPLQNSYPRAGLPLRPLSTVWAWPEYYIEDATSILTYGTLERTMAWKDIAPITNADSDIEAAANALYDAAAAHLAWYKDAQTTYAVNTLKVPSGLHVGDKVRLVYRGRVTRDGSTYSWLDVDTLFYVLKISRQYAANGAETASIEISNVARQALDDNGVVIGALQANEVWKTHVQSYPCRYQNTTTEMLWQGAGKVDVPIEIDESCIYLNNCKVHIRTLDILSPGITVDFDEWGTGIQHRHRHSTDPDHAENVFVTIMRLRVALVSGSGSPVDLTAMLGGPWAGGVQVHIDEEVDITEILRNASGGLKQKHWLRFSCDVGQGNLEVTTKMVMTVQSVIAS